VAQGQYVAQSLANYLQRHPDIEQRCTHGGTVSYLTTENPLRFKESAQLFLHEPVTVKHVNLNGGS
jgi:glutamate racemase